MDYTKISKKLAEMGKDQVRLKVNQGAFQKRKLPFIYWWLEHGEVPVRTKPEEVGEKTPVEELDTPTVDDVADYAKQLAADGDEIQRDMDQMIEEAEEAGEVTILHDDQAAGDSVKEIVNVGDDDVEFGDMVAESGDGIKRVGTADSDVNAFNSETREGEAGEFDEDLANIIESRQLKPVEDNPNVGVGPEAGTSINEDGDDLGDGNNTV